MRTFHTAKRFCTGALLAFLLILIDQGTKYLAVLKLKEQEPFVIIKDVFELRYLENRGAAFGVLQGRRMLFMVITVLAVVLLVYLYGRLLSDQRFLPLQGICIALFAGASGNFIDRLMHNYVIDFFYFSLIDFPIFNVADIYVTCAMALFMILFLFYYKETDLDRLAALIMPWKKRGVKS